jgi:GntR family transcriptional regulator
MWIEDTVDRGSQQKLYVQLYSIIKGKIEKGEWLSGAQIPTEDELCRAYDVSKATVRLAISELARDGYLNRQQGKGTFVAYSMPQSGMAMKTRLTEDMFGEGVNVKKEILVRSVEKPSEDVRGYLGSSDDIHYILSRRVAGDEPAFLEESFIPLFTIPDLEDEDFCRNSLYDLIQNRSHKRIHKVVQTIEVAEIRDEIASILRMQEGSSALLLHRLLMGHDKAPLAYTRIFGSGRKYKIQTEFEKIK